MKTNLRMDELTEKKHEGWLDKLAISMAVLCAVHCLIVPVLILAVPLISTTFFVHENFHLWMLVAVFPTTLASILLGCKKHRDKFVLASCFIGLAFLVGAYFMEQQGVAHCASCAGLEAHSGLGNIAWINTFGGIFLILAHSRNFYLCRKLSCCEHAPKGDCC
jgi:hypothetical protein